MITKYTRLDDISIPRDWDALSYLEAIEDLDENATGLSEEDIEFIEDCVELESFSDRQKKYIYKLHKLYGREVL